MKNTIGCLFVFTSTIALLVYYLHVHSSGISPLGIRPLGIRKLTPALQNSTTIVTAFFLFSKSKHSFNDYKQWIENLITYTDNPMVIFTSKSMLSSIENLRYTLQAQNRCMSYENCFPTIIITDYDTPWEMPPMRNITSVLRSQLNIDPEKHIHSPDLYAVWNAKAWMVEHVAAQNSFQTKYFLWVDAGAFRSAEYRFGSWPKNERAKEIFERNGQDKLLLGLMSRFSDVMCAQLRNISTPYSVQDGPLRRELIQGTMFGGSRKSIRWWSEVYYKTIALYISKNWFVGKDQDTMNSLALVYPDRINVFLTFKVNCADPWFAFGPLFADQHLVRTSFGDRCQLGNISSIVVSPRESCLN